MNEKDHLSMLQRWTAVHDLYGVFCSGVNAEIRRVFTVITEKNCKLCNTESPVFYFEGQRYPRWNKALYGVEVPTLHKELEPEMAQALAMEAEEQLISHRTTVFFKTVLFQDKFNKHDVIDRLPVVARQFLIERWNMPESGYTSFYAEEVAAELDIPDDIAESFNLRLVRLLLE